MKKILAGLALLAAAALTGCGEDNTVANACGKLGQSADACSCMNNEAKDLTALERDALLANMGDLAKLAEVNKTLATDQAQQAAIQAKLASFVPKVINDCKIVDYQAAAMCASIGQTPEACSCLVNETKSLSSTYHDLFLATLRGDTQHLADVYKTAVAQNPQQGMQQVQAVSAQLGAFSAKVASECKIVPH
jgi:hypothetical protein